MPTCSGQSPSDKRRSVTMSSSCKTFSKLRKEKCQFGVTEVKWFGMMFSKKGLSLVHEKTKDHQGTADDIMSRI